MPEELKTLEERVLEEVVERGQEIRLVFINGYQARVTIDEFDAGALLVSKDGKPWLVMRHAVSTIDLS